MSESKSKKELVPDFAVEDAEASEWGPLTEANADYEQLLAAPEWQPPGETENPPTENSTNPHPDTKDPEASEPKTDDVVSNLSESDVPESDVPESEFSGPDVPESDVPVSDVPESDVPESEFSEPDVPQSDVPESEFSESDVSGSEVSKSNILESDVSVSGIPPADAETPGFRGTLVTGDEVLNASIVVGTEMIVLWGAGQEIGTWNHEQAKIARLTFSRFAIQAEGDTLTFTADEPTALDQAIAAALNPETANAGETPPDPTASPVVTAARRPRIKDFQAEPTASDAATESGITPAERAIAAASLDPDDEPGEELETIAAASLDQEDEPGEEFGTIADGVRARSGTRTVRPRRFVVRPQTVLIKVGVLLAVAAVISGLVILVLFVTGRLGGGETTDTTTAAPRTTGIPVVITTAPPTTVATTQPPPMTTLFETSVPDLIERWNNLASASEVPLLLPPELTSPFFLLLAPNVTMEGVFDPTSGNVTLTGTPTGTPEGDGPIITALGLLIATADPSLDGNDRRALLAQLGLDVSDPDLAGIDGALTYNGLAYRLVYDQGANNLSLIVTPESAAAAPTTTN